MGAQCMAPQGAPALTRCWGIPLGQAGAEPHCAAQIPRSNLAPRGSPGSVRLSQHPELLSRRLLEATTEILRAYGR